MYGRKYRGCQYSKVYEVFDETGVVITHTYTAKQAKKEIDKHIQENKVK